MNIAAPLVFLGGSVGQTTWRDRVIPLLDAASVTYFDPRYKPGGGRWASEEEAQMKDGARVVLLVVSRETRATSTLVEVAEQSLKRPGSLVLVIEDVPEGSVIDGEEVGPRQLRDLNRGRAYARIIATQAGVRIYSSVAEAAQAVIDLSRG
jgi:hypothetical protein